MKSGSKLLLSILFVFSIQAIGGWFTDQGLGEWYDHLQKAPWTPPPYIFSIVWPILYFLIAFSLWNVWKSPLPKKRAITAFLFQLGLNFLWPICFFYYRSPLLGFVCLCILLLATIWNLYEFYRISAWAGFLLLPYLLWLIFALSLNSYIVIHN